jgi:hypothetical protein
MMVSPANVPFAYRLEIRANIPRAKKVRSSHHRPIIREKCCIRIWLLGDELRATLILTACGILGYELIFLAGITQLGFDIWDFCPATLLENKNHLFFLQEFFFQRLLHKVL